MKTTAADIKKRMQQFIEIHKSNASIATASNARKAEDAFKVLTVSQRRAQIAHGMIQRLDKLEAGQGVEKTLIEVVEAEVNWVTKALIDNRICNCTDMVRNVGDLLEQEATQAMLKVLMEIHAALKHEATVDETMDLLGDKRLKGGIPV